MQKRKHLVLLMGIFVCILFGLASNRRASALNCNNVTEAINSSVYQACHQYSSQNPVGTMWISSSSDSKNLNTSIETNQSSGWITVYLHGAIIGGGDATADYVKFSSRNFVSEEYNSVSDYAPLSTLGGNRSFIRKGNLNPGQNDIESSVVALRLSIDKLVEIENSYVPEGENYRRYAVELYGFRCFQGKTPFNNPRDCWANRSDVTVKIPQAPIQGRTSVTFIGDNRQSSTTWQSSDSEAETLFASSCEKGCKFDFVHSLNVKKGGTGVIKYKIRNEKNLGGIVSNYDRSVSYNGMHDYLAGTFKNIVLYPGETYCTTMTFPIGLGSKEAFTKVCAAATGAFESNIAVKARRWVNNGIVKEGSEIYVKPEDEIDFQVNYNSNTQKAGSIRVDTIKIADGEAYRSDSQSLYNLFNKYSDTHGGKPPTWKNAFTIILNKGNKEGMGYNVNTKCGNNVTGLQGDWVCNADFYRMKIKQDQVGESENVVADLNTNKKTVPTRVEFYSYDALKTTGKDIIIGSAVDNNLVLSYDGVATNGSNVLTRNKSAAVKKWALLPVKNESDYYYIADYYNRDYVLDVAEGKKDDGTNVRLYKQNNTDAQKWKLDRTGAGLYVIVSKLTREENKKTIKLVLDVEGARSGDVTNVRIMRDDASRAKEQRWNISRRQYLVANVNISPKESTARVLVPYNFKNTVALDLDEKESLSLSDNISYRIEVGAKTNREVAGETFATIVREAKHGVEWCVARENSDSKLECERDENGEKIINRVEKTLDKDSDKDLNVGENTVEVGASQLFKDLGVGSSVCVRAWVFPWTSGPDTKMDTVWDTTWKDNKNNTAYSDWWCLPIKEQDKYLQVWGGNVYSSNGIEGKSVEKQFGERKRWFGSFGELGVISGGKIEKFASGAAWGYEGVDSNTITVPSYSSMEGSGDEKVFAKATSENGDKLAFPNVGNNAGVNSNKQKVGALIDAVINGADKAGCSSEIVNGAGCKMKEDEGITVWSSEGDIQINEEINVPSGKMYIVRTSATVMINSNIIYNSFSSLDDIPRMIIYAKNISVDPGVGRIDGLLIADNNVNTCVKGDGANLNLGSCNNQLMINGAVIAKNLVRKRTYGAGEGVQSIVPAEIINFDPSLYDLSRLGGSSSVGEMKTVNTIELAPRY